MPSIDWFVPEHLREDLRTRRQGRILVGMSFSLAFAFLIGTLARQAIGSVPQGALPITVVVTSVFLAVPFLLRATGSLQLAGYVAVIGLTATDVGLVFLAGGLGAPMVLVFPVLPFAAVLLLDARAGVVVALVLCGVVLFFAFAPLAGIDLPAPAIGRDARMARALLLLLAMPAMVVFAAYFERQREEVELRLQEMLAELAARNADLERFTYTVSHDLKSPLVTVRGFLRVLQRDAAAGDRQKIAGSIDRIHRATSKMQNLVDGLLALSRVQRQAVGQTEVSPSAVARETVELLTELLSERRVEVEIAPDLPVVRGDPTLLHAIFQNLIENAVKFTAGQVAPRVRVGVRHDRGESVYLVSDNGAGIAREDQARIFSLFEQLAPAAGGSGIGLATVQRAVEAHGGRIWVESEGEGKGSTFCFTLPAETPPHPRP